MFRRCKETQERNIFGSKLEIDFTLKLGFHIALQDLRFIGMIEIVEVDGMPLLGVASLLEQNAIPSNTERAGGHLMVNISLRIFFLGQLQGKDHIQIEIPQHSGKLGKSQR